MTGRKVGRELYNLSLKLVDAGVKKVVVGEILKRVGDGIPVNMPEVNDEIKQANEYLLVTLHQQDKPELVFWRHKNVWNSQLNIYDKDGVHMNKIGDERIYWSVRGAIFKFIREIKEKL